MIVPPPLLLRDVEIDGEAGLDVRLESGRVAAIGRGLPADCEIVDGRGGALIPGLIDHHVHLLATAAARDSVSLVGVRDPEELAALLRDAAARRPAGRWLRAIGFHESRAGLLDRVALDRILPDRPVRVQHQTGSVWLLNSAALARIGEQGAPPHLERDGAGRLTGRIERADDWLRSRLGGDPPALAPIGAELAAMGVTGVSDASVTNDAGTVALFAAARASGALPQRIMVMSGGPLPALGEGLLVGPVKIVLDDHRLPPLDDVAATIDRARGWGRPVAVHCVTAGELALTLAAFGIAGARSGDRIEHGGVIPPESIAEISALGLTVVTQSAFPHERGDRYLAQVDPVDQPDLYRCASLRAAGIAVAGSSDTPYADLDPWAAMRAAVARRTRAGHAIGLAERLSPRAALGLYLGDFHDPGGPPRTVRAGAIADLCLLRAPIADVLRDLAGVPVAATIVAGRVVYRVGSITGKSF